MGHYTTQILQPKSYRILTQPKNKNKKIKYQNDWNHQVIIISLKNDYADLASNIKDEELNLRKKQ